MFVVGPFQRFGGKEGVKWGQTSPTASICRKTAGTTTTAAAAALQKYQPLPMTTSMERMPIMMVIGQEPVQCSVYGWFWLKIVREPQTIQDGGLSPLTIGP